MKCIFNLLLCAMVLIGTRSMVAGNQKSSTSTAMWVIQSDRLGPLRLGMSESEVVEVARKHGLSARKRMASHEGEMYPEIIVSRSGSSFARLDLDKRRVYRIVVLSGRFRTSEKLGIGTSVDALAKRYGKGAVGVGEGTVCALFARKPGISFCLTNSAELLRSGQPSWTTVLRRNPKVERVLIVGREA